MITGSSEQDTRMVRPLEATNGVHCAADNGARLGGGAGLRDASGGRGALKLRPPAKDRPSAGSPASATVASSTSAVGGTSTLCPTISFAETWVTSCKRMSGRRTSPMK